MAAFNYENPLALPPVSETPYMEEVQSEIPDELIPISIPPEGYVKRLVKLDEETGNATFGYVMPDGTLMWDVEPTKNVLTPDGLPVRPVQQQIEVSQPLNTTRSIIAEEDASGNMRVELRLGRDVSPENEDEARRIVAAITLRAHADTPLQIMPTPTNPYSILPLAPGTYGLPASEETLYAGYDSAYYQQPAVEDLSIDSTALGIPSDNNRLTPTPSIQPDSADDAIPWDSEEQPDQSEENNKRRIFGRRARQSLSYDSRDNEGTVEPLAKLSVNSKTSTTTKKEATKDTAETTDQEHVRSGMPIYKRFIVGAMYMAVANIGLHPASTLGEVAHSPHIPFNVLNPVSPVIKGAHAAETILKLGPKAFRW